MTDETMIRLNRLVAKYGLYCINLVVSKMVAIYGPGNGDEIIYIEHSKLIKPDWRSIEKTLVEYILLHGF